MTAVQVDANRRVEEFKAMNVFFAQKAEKSTELQAKSLATLKSLVEGNAAHKVGSLAGLPTLD